MMFGLLFWCADVEVFCARVGLAAPQSSDYPVLLVEETEAVTAAAASSP